MMVKIEPRIVVSIAFAWLVTLTLFLGLQGLGFPFMACILMQGLVGVGIPAAFTGWPRTGPWWVRMWVFWAILLRVPPRPWVRNLSGWECFDLPPFLDTDLTLREQQLINEKMQRHNDRLARMIDSLRRSMAEPN